MIDRILFEEQQEDPTKGVGIFRLQSNGGVFATLYEKPADGWADHAWYPGKAVDHYDFKDGQWTSSNKDPIPPAVERILHNWIL